MTSGSARQQAAASARDAVVTTLAPICAERFRTQADGAAQVAALAKSSSWERGTIIEKSEFALMPDSKTTDSDVARAYGEMLATPLVPKS